MANPTKQYGATEAEGAERQHQQDQAREALGRARESATQMGSALEDAGARAADFARSQTRDMRRMVEDRAEELVAWIKGRPITSVLIGAAVGYLFGRMGRR